jgi:sucrose phosphorylase
LVFGQVVTIHDQGQDRYGRTIGDIHAGETWVNLAMVRNGWAWHYKKHSKDSRLADRVLEVSGLHERAGAGQDDVKRWDQNDMLMITYGDSIRTPHEAPLKTLHRFLQKKLKGAINGVHILPFTPYSSDDGFSVIDYTTVNPDLGDWSDLEAIGQDFTLMADLVLNHCSIKSPWFLNFLSGKSPGKNYFIEASAGDDVSKVVRPRAHPLLTAFETSEGQKHLWCTFSEDQIDLNFRNSEVLCEFIDIIRQYIEHGIRFFRLDAVAYLWKEPGTNCVHLPETHEVIKLLRLIIENLCADAVIITETNVPNRENLSYFGNDNEAHLIYNFSLPPLLLNTMLTGNCKHLMTWMMSMPPARIGRAYLNFIASHDGIGLRPTEGLLSEQELDQLLDTVVSFGGTISHRHMPDGNEKPYEANISLCNAMQGTIANGPDGHQLGRFICAHTIMMALEGIPAFYIHSLLGTENDLDRVVETGRARSINRHVWDQE